MSRFIERDECLCQPCLYLLMVCVMEDWRWKAGLRVSKKSRGGDWRWVVSTGMLMLRRKP